MAVDDVYQVEAIYNAAGEYAVNLFHVKEVSAGPTDPLAAAANVVNGFSAQFLTDILACLSADISVEGFRARRISPTGGPSAALLTPGNVGSVSGVSNCAGIGAVIKMYYQDVITTKWRTGRFTMPSSPIAYIEGNSLQPAYITPLVNFTEDLEEPFDGATSGTFQPGTWSKKSGGHFYDGTNWTISDKVGVQRRRLRPSL
jgi:hypothetical protein